MRRIHTPIESTPRFDMIGSDTLYGPAPPNRLRAAIGGVLLWFLDGYVTHRNRELAAKFGWEIGRDLSSEDFKHAHGASAGAEKEVA